MRRVIMTAIAIWILLLALSGCWNRRELTNLAIAAALGIDKSGDQYRVSVQIINPGQVAQGGQKGSGGVDSPVTVYSEIGVNLFETLRKLSKQLPRKVYYSHLRMVVIGEEMAKQGIRRPIDFMNRDHEMRTDFYIAIAKDTTAYNILTTYTSLEQIPANKMFASLENSAEVWAATGKVRLDQMISDMENQGKSLVLTGIKLKGDIEKRISPENVLKISPSAVLQYVGLGVFKDDRLIGWLNEEESKGYNYIVGDVKSTIINIKQVCEEDGRDSISTEMIRTEVKKKGRLEKSRPQIQLTVKGEANIGESECYLDLMNNELIREIELAMNEAIVKKIEDTIKTVQEEYKVDIFGFGEAMRRAEPVYWREAKADWDKEFEHLQVDVQADIRLRRIGTINNPIKSN